MVGEAAILALHLVDFARLRVGVAAHGGLHAHVTHEAKRREGKSLVSEGMHDDDLVGGLDGLALHAEPQVDIGRLQLPRAVVRGRRPLGHL
eukprot:scaffold109079_cov36-Phaeocystis_antarctica.AAC.1